MTPALWRRSLECSGAVHYTVHALYHRSLICCELPADCLFANLGHGEPPITLRLNDSSLALENCSFEGNTVSSRLGMITYDGIDAAFVQMQNVTFATNNVGNVQQTLLGINSSQWFTDGCETEWPCNVASVAPVESGLTQPTKSIAEVPGGVFLVGEDPWLVKARTV